MDPRYGWRKTVSGLPPGQKSKVEMAAIGSADNARGARRAATGGTTRSEQKLALPRLCRGTPDIRVILACASEIRSFTMNAVPASHAIAEQPAPSGALAEFLTR